MGQLEGRLRAIMDAWPMDIEAGCRDHLNQLIATASAEFASEGASSPRLVEAEVNFRKILAEMTRQAGVLGFDELHEPTFFAAMSRLCPIWPFC